MNITVTRAIGVSCWLIIVVLSVTNASASAETLPPTRLSSASEGRIVVLGDSLAVSPSHSESFPAQLQQRLKKSGLHWTVTNAGIRGDKTAGGLRRFNVALPPDTRILILELGANDGLRGVEIATIEKNLATMIEGAQARHIKVLLCGMIVPPRFGWNYMLAFQGVFPRLAAKYNVPLVPFLLDGVALQADMNTPDGIHPNGAGAKRIANTVWPYLQPLVHERTATASSR
jgi:acyl-CoA thioesterase-1